MSAVSQAVQYSGGLGMSESDAIEIEARRNTGENTKTELHTVSGSKWTFEDDPVRNWVENRLQGRVLNACAG